VILELPHPMFIRIARSRCEFYSNTCEVIKHSNTWSTSARVSSSLCVATVRCYNKSDPVPEVTSPVMLPWLCSSKI